MTTDAECRRGSSIVTTVKPFGRTSLCREKSIQSGTMNPERTMPFLKKVVVGEDEDAIAHLIEATLGDAGWLCLRGKDGEAAFEMVKNEEPDLLILDVLMPRMD